jgi:hypothetical protein
MTLLHLLLLRVSSVILGAGPDLSYLSRIWGPPHTVMRYLVTSIYAKIFNEQRTKYIMATVAECNGNIGCKRK